VNFVDPWGLITAIFDAGTNKITIFSNEGSFLGQYDAQNLVIRDSKGQFPAGKFNFGTPRGPRQNCSNESTGEWFIPIDVPPETGRRDMGLHGGGTGLKEPCSGKQGWQKTKGCIRVQNEDLAAIVRLINQDIERGNSNIIHIIPAYPFWGIGR
jgi:hypothetical protein